MADQQQSPEDAISSVEDLKRALKNVEGALDDAYSDVEATTLKDLTDLDEISGAIEDSMNAAKTLIDKLEDLEED